MENPDFEQNWTNGFKWRSIRLKCPDSFVLRSSVYFDWRKCGISAWRSPSIRHKLITRRQIEFIKLRPHDRTFAWHTNTPTNRLSSFIPIWRTGSTQHKSNDGRATALLTTTSTITKTAKTTTTRQHKPFYSFGPRWLQWLPMTLPMTLPWI